MRTALCDRLGIGLPIIQAAMGGATSPVLAAAVSEAGGLGMLPLSWAEEADLRRQIREVRARTDRPFGANLVLAWPQAERLALVLDEGVRVVSFFWGEPAPALVARVHAAGALALHTVGSAAEARRAVDCGIDVVVAQGWEAGGHVYGTVATLALVPAVVDAVAPVPVVAAGGIADGRGLAAVLALGAAGAWIGTRLLASAEAPIHAHYRDRLLAAGEADTVHTRLFDGGWPVDAPHRVLRNATIAAWEAAGAPPPGRRPGEGEVVATSATGGGPVPRYESDVPRPDAEGDVEAMALYAGQGVGLVRRVQPAGEIVREIAEEARAVLRRLGAAARDGLA